MINFYDAVDFVTKTPNEKKRNKYKKLSEKMSKKLEKLNLKITKLEGEINDFPSVYRENDQLYGDIIDKYKSFSKSGGNLISDEITSIKEFRDRLSVIHDEVIGLYRKYYDACELEDKEGRK